MLYTIPSGQTVQIRNTTEHTVQNLYYTFGTMPDTKINKIKAGDDERFMIARSSLQQDFDLIFYFENNPDQKFVFKNAVKKNTKTSIFSYFFGKIVEEKDVLYIERDTTGEELYFDEE